MGWHKPEPPLVWRAIVTYLSHAYDGPPDPHGVPKATPSSVRSRLDLLRTAPAEGFFASTAFERDAAPAAATGPTRFSLRLGNRTYPHMKLVIDRAPDGRGHLLRADTHDGHCRPAPGSRDFHLFCQLMDANRELADRIEGAWEAEGLPTFKSYLRDDLARRRASKMTANEEISNPNDEAMTKPE